MVNSLSLLRRAEETLRVAAMILREKDMCHLAAQCQEDSDGLALMLSTIDVPEEEDRG